MGTSWQYRVLRYANHTSWLLTGLWLVLGGVAVAYPWRWAAVVPMLLAGTSALVTVRVWARWRRQAFVREAPLPQFLKRKLRETYPHLNGKDCELVERGLRQFFLACLRSNQQFVAMPSRAVDAMWHEFILHTHAYDHWCRLALGRFLHHTPAEVLGVKAKNNDGLRRAWYWSCRDEAIQPGAPSRLPLLFAIDTKLAIANGFHYTPNCSGILRKNEDGGTADGGVYCGTSFSDNAYSGNSDSFGGADASDSDGDGGGGGDGGCGGD